MPRYDDSPTGHRSGQHSPLDHRRPDHRRLKSPMMADTRRRPQRDSPMSSSSMRTMNPRDNYDDYRNHSSANNSGHHRNTDGSGGGTGMSMPYKILCVSNISNKYSDNEVRSELNREFHRFGEPNIKLVYDDNTRLAYLYFSNYDDARDARHAKSRLFLFDKQIIIDPIYDRTIQLPRRRSVTPDYQMSGSRRTNARPLSPPMPRRPPPPPGRNNDMKYNMQPHRDNHREMHPMRNDYHHPGGAGGGGGGGGGGSGGGGGGGGSGNRQQHRDSKKEKFPNYLTHVSPEDDEKSTRTLFVGNLEVNISESDLRRIFERYGDVEDIDIKRHPPGEGNAFAFIKFLNLDMAYRSKVEMSGQYIGKFQCKIGYGKATPTTRIWVGGLGPWTSPSQLATEFDRFGVIRKIDFVRGENHAYIQYDTIDAAHSACSKMRGFPLGGHDKRLRVDYADPGPYSFISPSHGTGVNAGAGDQYATPTGPRKEDNGDDWAHTAKYGQNAGDYNESFERNTPQNRNREFNEEIKREREVISTANNNNNYDQWWGDSTTAGQYSPNAERRRRRTPEDAEPTLKRQRRNTDSPTPGDDRSLSPRRHSLLSPNYETNGKDDNGVGLKVTVSDSVLTIQELAKCCPPAWNGGLILKSSSFPSRMLYCAGDSQLVDLLMKDNSNPEQPVLRITQRLRLERGKLDDVSRRMSLAGSSGYCLLLTTGGAAQSQPTGQLSEDGSAIQLRPLKNLVTYLKQKDAAGVITLTSAKDVDIKGVLYLFPPCAYAIDQLKKVAPNLSIETNLKEDYLVVVVVRGTN
ncbi:RNA-binding protein spenito-like isoform X2 [Oppia nitens]|uniref:RNA-binding protein spenito-like isoform X2 n=1 Tax=Oppia nitens TaxID=1686743 RepID=UPI0023DB1E63|nr:RNA-binding protein spenito-like isoform X2 [Oppia nitens]